MSRVTNSVGVERELAPDPGSIGQGAEGASEQVHGHSPRERSPTLQVSGSMPELGLPLPPPVRPGRGRDQDPHDGDDEQREPERQAEHHEDPAGRRRRSRAVIDRGTR